MEPEDFIKKWRDSELSERSASQSHFNDLCELLDVPKPATADPKGTTYTFDKALKKPGGTQGFADVWKKNCFAWEYKGDLKNLVRAYAQIKEYADALENPPLLIVSDMKEIRVHTNFNSEVAQQTVFKIADLVTPEVRQKLQWAWTEPERWRPTKTREMATREAAAAFAEIAQKLRTRGHDPKRVAHFLNKIVFCLFAEDIELLPNRVFADILEEAAKHADQLDGMLHDLFRAMKDKGGRFGTQPIPWFNGGLFDDDDVLDIHPLDIPLIVNASRLDWSAIDPFIFGTLFEKGLDPERRKEMAGLFDPKAQPIPAPRLFTDKHHDKGVGIHYTDPATIQKLIEPVVLRPWRAEWDKTKAEIAALREKKKAAKGSAAQTKIEGELRAVYLGFRDRLGKFRVLDPACGSGNFLYLALRQLKDFDRDVLNEAKELELPADNQRVGPECVMGIEVNPYAAELARVTVWIAEIQWQIKNYGPLKRSPILGKLDGIICRDAVLSSERKEATWPTADVVVGNPPFLGNKGMLRSLGEEYVRALRVAYEGRVPYGSDLVCYWFEKAHTAIAGKKLTRAGLIATNSIRGGMNRKVLTRINESEKIFEAWSDEPWVLEGAAVRVSIVCFANDADPACQEIRLDGKRVERIFDDLSCGATDLTKAKRLNENLATAFQGSKKVGPFEVPGSTARAWLTAPLNPNGRPNTDVLKPSWIAMDVVRNPRDFWIVDFGLSAPEGEAALYEFPFKFVSENVRPLREKNNRESRKRHWWRHGDGQPAMRAAISNLHRYIVTPEVAKHRIFRWALGAVLPDCKLMVIARDDDVTFGILHSRFHELWSLRCGMTLEDRPTYTPSTTFETFPFPEGLTPNIPATRYVNDPRAKKIAAAAKRLNELRENWLNPEDLVKREAEVVPGFPDRILPRTEKAAEILKKRTLTNLYNERPAWLVNAHKDLDDAVAAAYGWPADLSDDEVLARLFALNQSRAGAAKTKGAESADIAPEGDDDDPPPPKKKAAKNRKRAAGK